MLRIRFADGCEKKSLLIQWAGLRSAKRAAAEIDAMAHDPSLRPC